MACKRLDEEPIRRWKWQCRSTVEPMSIGRWQWRLCNLRKKFSCSHFHFPETHFQRRNLQYQKPCASPFITAVITIAIRPFATNATEQTADDAHQHEQQCRANAQQSVIDINIIFVDVLIGRIQMIICRSGSIRNTIQRIIDDVRNIPHGRTSLTYRSRYFRNSTANRFIDVSSNILQFLLTLRYRLNVVFADQIIDISNQRRHIWQLIERKQRRIYCWEEETSNEFQTKLNTKINTKYCQIKQNTKNDSENAVLGIACDELCVSEFY